MTIRPTAPSVTMTLRGSPKIDAGGSNIGIRNIGSPRDAWPPRRPSTWIVRRPTSPAHADAPGRPGVDATRRRMGYGSAGGCGRLHRQPFLDGPRVAVRIVEEEE